MSCGIALLALLALVPPPPQAGPEERAPEEVIAALGSDSARERAAAERWLGARAVRGHYPLLARAAQGADAEIRRRLVRALGSDAVHLDLALLFLAEADAALQAIGREAIESLVMRWSEGLAEPPLFGTSASKRLREIRQERRPRVMLIDLDASPAENLGLLARTQSLPLGLVHDPGPGGAGDVREPGSRPMAGGWDDLLPRIARANGLRLELHGAVRLEGGLGDGFVRLTAPAGRATNTATLLTDWCRALVVETPAEKREEVARQLASTGWPAILDWLEQEWLRSGDPAALSGLLLAASTGNVSFALARPESVRRCSRRPRARSRPGTPTRGVVRTRSCRLSRA
jgi:hypothetical protein